jgi:hypothetical protein
MDHLAHGLPSVSHRGGFQTPRRRGPSSAAATDPGEEEPAMTETAICAYCRDLIHLEEEIFVAVRGGSDVEETEARYAHADCAPPQRRRGAPQIPARLERSHVSPGLRG